MYVILFGNFVIHKLESTMNEKQKVLLCGNVNGKIDALFTRVETINKKSGPFDLLLCVGSFFGSDNGQLSSYKNGSKKVPVTTYVVGPVDNSHKSLYPEEGEEICPNLIYIGKRGVFATAGLKIAYATGYEGSVQNSDTSILSEADCIAVRDACFRGQSEYRGVDILITTSWPKGVQEPDVKVRNVKESPLITWLAMHIKPRYHLVPSDILYYERAPYRNPSVQEGYHEGTTRFIALAPVGNSTKDKWIYACSLQPINKMRMMELLQSSTDETPCPYEMVLLTQHVPGKTTKFTGSGQFFYDMNAQDGRGNKRKGRNDDRERKKPEFDPDSCWFCLSSPSVEKHLVISVGTHCYLALAKGPLTPEHVLILPVTHHQSTTQASDEVNDEIKKFKSALRRMFLTMKQSIVFFERNYKTSHLQIQCVPIPKIAEGDLLELFQDEGGIQSIQLDVLPPYSNLCQIAAPGTPYFHAELPTGEQIFTRVRSNFPLQFGRDVLSSTTILNCEDKADWRQCQLSKDEEIKYVEEFREKFQPFDFTLEDD